MKSEQMRITAHLRTAVISDGYLPLDGILYASMIRQTFGAEEVTIPGDMAQWGGGHVSVPLQRKAQSGQWFYACSFADWGARWVDDRGFWVKRFDQAYSDMIDFGGRAGRVDTSAGTYKGYNMPVFARHALCVRWYAVGDMQRVSDLLADVTHIGKKPAQGWGRVNGWEIEPWPDDWSVRRGGQLTRAVPAVPAASGMLYGIRPPYWRAGNQCLCEMPAAPQPAKPGGA